MPDDPLTIWDILSPIANPESWEWTISRKNREAYVRVSASDDVWQALERETFLTAVAAAGGTKGLVCYDEGTRALRLARDGHRDADQLKATFDQPWPKPGLDGIENARFKVVYSPLRGQQIVVLEGLIKGVKYDAVYTIGSAAE